MKLSLDDLKTAICSIHEDSIKYGIDPREVKIVVRTFHKSFNRRRMRGVQKSDDIEFGIGSRHVYIGGKLG